MWEIDFVRTSCRILDISSKEMINRIVKRALDKGCGQAKRVMASICTQLDDLGKRVGAGKGNGEGEVSLQAAWDQGGRGSHLTERRDSK
jgi:hypothetical protein